jgi:hypothetical protein
LKKGFYEIQNTAPPKVLEEMMAIHSGLNSGTRSVEEWEDEFWK